MTRYRNQSFTPGKPEYGPEEYVTHVDSDPYRGFDIYERLPAVFDIVQEGVCVGQYAGYGGATRAIDTHLDGVGISYLRIPESGGDVASAFRP